MDPEVLRDKLMRRLDALLARTFLITGEDRRLLAAVRAYMPNAPREELVKVAGYLGYNAPPSGKCPRCKGSMSCHSFLSRDETYFTWVCVCGGCGHSESHRENV